MLTDDSKLVLRDRLRLRKLAVRGRSTENGDGVKVTAGHVLYDDAYSMEISHDDLRNGYLHQQQQLSVHGASHPFPANKSWSSTCPRRKRDNDASSRRRNSMSDIVASLNAVESPPIVRCSGNGGGPAEARGVSFFVPDVDGDVAFIRSPGRRRTSTFRPCIVGGGGERGSMRSRPYVYSVQDRVFEGDEGPYYFKLDPRATGTLHPLLRRQTSSATARPRPDLVRQSCAMCNGHMTSEDTDSTT